MAKNSLRFSDLSERHIGVTPALAATLAEAASVCLDRHHSPPADFTIQDNGNVSVAEAAWGATDERTRNAWANQDDATELGACGLALAAIELTRGLVAVGRAERRTGADYYLGPPCDALDDLEKALRLEVSGTDAGDQQMISRRLQVKIEQALNGESNLPAVAAVVGMSARSILSRDVED